MMPADWDVAWKAAMKLSKADRRKLARLLLGEGQTDS
jgi:hypothetical protein